MWIDGSTSDGGTSDRSTDDRADNGSSISDAPSTCSTSKKNAPVVSRPLIVSWNRRGRPSSSMPSDSPSSTIDAAGSAATAATTLGNAAVTSFNPRENRRTRSPALCACTRIPSSFHSTLAGPVATSASLALADVAASIGWTATSGVRPTSRSSPASARAAAAPRSPRSIAARRSAVAGTPAAFATASATTPSFAP